MFFIQTTSIACFIGTGPHHRPSAGSVQRTSPGNEGRRKLLRRRERRRREAEIRSASAAATPPAAAAAGTAGTTLSHLPVLMQNKSQAELRKSSFNKGLSVQCRTTFNQGSYRRWKCLNFDLVFSRFKKCLDFG